MVPPPPPDDRFAVTLRYWASARAAAGTDSEVVAVEGATTVEAVLDEVRRRHADSDRFADVVGCCSLLLGDRPVTSEDLSEVVVRPGDSLELLPPFAGG